ncbi:MAG: DUF2975 domain-containing protein [Bifidobacteriaceae bacterium]|jgi:hypothetical protein|nr:DUF2975 domain-containing protein [Bifidobacteriaceae bacterium]
MTKTRLARALIILLMALMAPCQVFVVPLIAAEAAQSAPEFAHLRWPLLILAEFMMAVADLAGLALVKLASMAARGVVFSGAAARWVDVVVIALWVETAAVLPWLWVSLFATKGPPGAAAACLIALPAGAAGALVVSTMKALLVQATSQADELAEVI